MGVRYPGPVSRHNLVCLLLMLLWYLVPVWDRVRFATTVAVDAFGRCLQRGKVIGVRYPGPVSRHNLVCP